MNWFKENWILVIGIVLLMLFILQQNSRDARLEQEIKSMAVANDKLHQQNNELEQSIIDIRKDTAQHNADIQKERDKLQPGLPAIRIIQEKTGAQAALVLPDNCQLKDQIVICVNKETGKEEKLPDAPSAIYNPQQQKIIADKLLACEQTGNSLQGCQKEAAASAQEIKNKNEEISNLNKSLKDAQGRGWWNRTKHIGGNLLCGVAGMSPGLAMGDAKATAVGGVAGFGLCEIIRR